MYVSLAHFSSDELTSLDFLKGAYTRCFALHIHPFQRKPLRATRGLGRNPFIARAKAAFPWPLAPTRQTFKKSLATCFQRLRPLQCSETADSENRLDTSFSANFSPPILCRACLAMGRELEGVLHFRPLAADLYLSFAMADGRVWPVVPCEHVVD